MNKKLFFHLLIQSRLYPTWSMRSSRQTKDSIKLISQSKESVNGPSLISNSLRKIIENLMSNSIKYSNQNSLIHIKMICQPATIQIVITDHGIGISADEIKLVYDPFYRGKNVSTISGTGLGLTIVHQAVIRSGGSMNIESGFR